MSKEPQVVFAWYLVGLIAIAAVAVFVLTAL